MHTDAIDDNGLRDRLREIADANPEVAPTARLYGAILPVLRAEAPPVLPAGPSADEVKTRLEQGIPLLEGRDLEIDVQQVTGLVLRLADAAEKIGARVSAENVRRWIDQEYGGDAGAAFHGILACESRPRKELERMGVDSDVLGLIAETAMKPLLRAWRSHLAPLAAAVRWEKGSCFVCGSEPFFAELQGNDQEKHLRCGLCGADWRVNRLSCPHCGNEDHRSLRVFLQENDPGKPRIEACDRCMTYVKVIPAFSPTPVDLLPVEDLATVRLDAEAQRRGYRRACGTE